MKGNTRKGKQRRGANTPWRHNDPMKLCYSIGEPQQPTAWDEFLRGLGISEATAYAIAQGRVEGPRSKLREWAAKHRETWFVPEGVLEALGLRLKDSQVSAYPDPFAHGGRAQRRRGAFPAAE